jgi:hypothetical protein
VCEGGFQYITDAVVSAATEWRDVEGNGMVGGKKKETDYVFYSLAL